LFKTISLIFSRGERVACYANVIVDISLEKLDKTFAYLVPDELQGQICEGTKVEIPFGSRKITGYVIGLTDEPGFDVSKIRPIIGIAKDGIAVEAQLIALAAWMRKNYGSTMNQALKTVLPVHRQTRQVEKRYLVLQMDEAKAKELLALYENKKYHAKARLLRELIRERRIEYAVATGKLHVTAATISGMAKQDILREEKESTYRDPIAHLKQNEYRITLTEEQQKIVDLVEADRKQGIAATYLLKGVTGSGKTEVYMELIARTIARGRQAIMLIPEIALTYQTVMRFKNRFGDRVSILNSRLSQGERYDQYLRAKNGDIDIMIGPRSALFSPFDRLGLIIIDEEHESSYKSETAPRYHARETAIERARMNGASVILGSATPSVESYYQVTIGNYRLLELNNRIGSSRLPECEVVDLREELRLGNRSILSLRLQELMEERLEMGQQIMLFLNRRGVAGFVSCRACGHVVKCPHCDVSLSQHNDGRMVCHYCGYTQPVPETCPACSSRYISGFKAGTQKVEQMVQSRFPHARVLRMDFDTTRTKDGYEKILSAFSNREADILIGTQMIVKGHDFANVTLVGILAADMSLHVGDYHAAERTFQLLTQAAGRAGRGECPGQVIIQTYSPDHYAVQTAKEQDYEAFYAQEIAYRQMLNYPPVWNLLVVMCTSPNAELLQEECESLRSWMDTLSDETKIQIVGPADASVSKINDIYRKVIYLKTADYNRLVAAKDAIEQRTLEQMASKDINIQFDFNPMSGF
jgi:primosomal protein N' (replication factor Y)